MVLQIYVEFEQRNMAVKGGIQESNFISTSQSTNEMFLVKEKLQKTVV